MKSKQFKSNINIGLRYDRIYYFPSRTDSFLNELMDSAVEQWKCRFKIREMLNFYYELQLVPKDLMAKLYEAASLDNEEGAYNREVLQEMMGDINGGVLVVRLYSKEEDEPDELLVYSDLPCFSLEDAVPLNTISEEAANINFERLTGESYDSYKKKLDDEIKEYCKPSLDVLITSSREFSKIRFPDHKTRRRLSIKLTDIQSQIDKADNEALTNILEKMITELGDENKLMRKCKIIVEKEKFKEYKESSEKYEIYVIKNEKKDERIRCDFTRDFSKAYYVFLLKHPEGFNKKEHSKYRVELINLYGKFSDLERGNLADSVDDMFVNNSIYQFNLDIKNTFEGIFRLATASHYRVKAKKGTYQVTIDRTLVDIGNLETAK